MATPTLIASVADGGGSTVGPTSGINTTGATKLCVEVRSDTTNAPTVSDSRTNTWAADGTPTSVQFSGFPGWIHTFEATGTVSVGTGHTFTAAGGSGATFVTIAVIAVGPGGGGTVSTEGPLLAADVSLSSPWLAPAVTPSTADALLVTTGGTNGVGASISRDWSASSFTEVSAENDQNNFWGVGIATRTVTSIAAYAASFTDNSTSSDNAGFAAWAFTESGGGGVVTAWLRG